MDRIFVERPDRARAAEGARAQRAAGRGAPIDGVDNALIGFVEICVETESEIVRTEAARSGEVAGIQAGRPLIGALARAARNARTPAVRGSAGDRRAHI